MIPLARTVPPFHEIAGFEFAESAVDGRDNKPEQGDDSTMPITLPSTQANCRRNQPFATCRGTTQFRPTGVSRTRSVKGLEGRRHSRQVHRPGRPLLARIMAQPQFDVPRIDLIDSDPKVIDWAMELLRPTGASIFSHAGGLEFRERFAVPRQGCVVLEVRLPGGLSGLEVLAELRRTAEQIPVIVLTGFADVPMAVQAMSAGAFAFLEKTCRPQDLWDTVGRALARSGEISVEAGRKSQLARTLQSLTPEQRSVMRLAFEGRTNKAIAQALIISPRTVDVRRKEILAAFHAGSFMEIFGSLVELQLLPRPH